MYIYNKYELSKQERGLLYTMKKEIVWNYLVLDSYAGGICILYKIWSNKEEILEKIYT